ncbi:hypothetical protein, partial [Brevibacillus sp. 179-C1.2 HS]
KLMATTAFTIRDFNPRDNAHAGRTWMKRAQMRSFLLLIRLICKFVSTSKSWYNFEECNWKGSDPMLYFVSFVVALFLLSFFNTLRQVIHNPNQYLPSAAITALLGAFLFFFVIKIVLL